MKTQPKKRFIRFVDYLKWNAAAIICGATPAVPLMCDCSTDY